MDAYEIRTAKPIKPYVGPQWFIEPAGPKCDTAEVDAINQCKIELLDNLTGWDPYTHVVTATDDEDVTRFYIALVVFES